MQVQEEQIKRQQEILKVLGFYTASVDGTWGPLTILAKKKFEASSQFAPGIPNNGLPFKTGQRLPSGMTQQRDGLLHHVLLDVPVASPEE
jgi:peptidoglycan hydrolase-like protein with peptidoglycan-binding domain